MGDRDRGGVEGAEGVEDIGCIEGYSGDGGEVGKDDGVEGEYYFDSMGRRRKRKDRGYYAEIGRRGGLKNKGRKHTLASIRKEIRRELSGGEGANWEKAEPIIEKNILELLTHTDAKVRMQATKAFAEFLKSKKRESKAGGDGGKKIIIEIVYEGKEISREEVEGIEE